MRTFETPNGKKIELYNEGYGVKAKFTGGGQLPDCLAGTWTSEIKATQSINMYLNDMEPLHIEEKDEDGIFQKVKNPRKNTIENA